MRRSVYPLSSCELVAGSRKATKDINNIDIFNWIPWTSHGMTLRVLKNEKFTFEELTTKADNFVNNNFFKLARIANSLEKSDFEILETIMPQITQYLKFEDSSVKIAGSNIDHH
ncbi:hypothetical protein RBEMOGI_1464 [Rickettsia bellii str. RML Mogi]|uniref:Uncharacterized protein n=1 Tax=Rickettsia bellii str. RML Mogi TaxID=1359194 RepID=A0A0F3QKR2_RICBE|nr:hypothetical protein RBEMOGI_1464 [Rickettsia bellii str. RML Mogi]